MCVHICELPPQTRSKDISLVLERSMKVKGWIKVSLKCLHLFLKARLLHTSSAVFVFMVQRQKGEDTLPFCSSHWLVKTEVPRAMPATTGRQSDANFAYTITHIPKTHIHHLTHTLFCLIYWLIGVWPFFFVFWKIDYLARTFLERGFVFLVYKFNQWEYI